MAMANQDQVRLNLVVHYFQRLGKSRELPDYEGVGKRHADPEGGSSGDSGGAGSMSSGSSSSGSPFFRSVSSKGASDISSDGGDAAVGETQKAVDDDDKPEPDFSRRVRIYVEAGSELVEKGSIGMFECKGYYTFARELRSELEVEVETEDDDASVVLAHVVAPWAPQYQLAEYYAPDNQGGRVSLNPLELVWSDFSRHIDYVIMRRSEVNGVTFALMMDNAPLWELNIPAFLLGSREYFLKIAHLFLVAQEGKDPSPFGLENWLTGGSYSVRYLDEAGLELHYIYHGEDDNAPDNSEPGEDENARDNSEPGEDDNEPDNSEPGEDDNAHDNSESGESFVAGDTDQLEELQRLFSVSDEESSGEIVDGQGDSPENAATVDAMDIVLEVATGEDADQLEADGDGVADDHGWNEVSERLARVEFIPS